MLHNSVSKYMYYYIQELIFESQTIYLFILKKQEAFIILISTISYLSSKNREDHGFIFIFIMDSVFLCKNNIVDQFTLNRWSSRLK